MPDHTFAHSQRVAFAEVMQNMVTAGSGLFSSGDLVLDRTDHALIQYIYRSNLELLPAVMSRMASDLGIPAQTISRRVQQLVEARLIFSITRGKARELWVTEEVARQCSHFIEAHMKKFISALRPIWEGSPASGEERQDLVVTHVRSLRKD